MSVFANPGFYLRAHDGGVEDLSAMKAAGFRWVALTMQAPYDYSLDQWAVVIQRATAAGVQYLPWAFLNNDADCWKLREVALACGQQQNLPPAGIWDAEKPLDATNPGGATLHMDACVASAAGIDGLLSVEPIPFDGVNWWQWPGTIDCQLFPAENSASSDPRGCRSRYYAYGANRVQFQYGIHNCTSGAFPYREAEYSVYTADDASQQYAPWRPQGELPPKGGFTYEGPFYGPSSPKGPSKAPGVKVVKMALHNAGFGDFTNPDGFYNIKCERAMKAMQRFYGIPATGQFGKGSWERMLRLPSAIPRHTYALA